MSSKIEISRELLQQVFEFATYRLPKPVFDQLQAILAAPVVERQQPFAWFTDDYLTDKSSTTYDELTSARWKAKGWSVQPLFTVPPELAELQAAIAQLTAERDIWRKGSEENNVRANSFARENERLTAEIERLKGGQGELNQCDGCQAGIPLVNGLHRMGRDNGYSDPMGCTANRYVQQKPASIVLPDRMEEAYFPEDTPHDNKIWNACLDKVKELNQ